MADRPDLDALVVGSGPNGLVAAVRLAEAGATVLVLEADAQAGGGLRSAELTLPGFVHDLCSSVHPLALGSPAFRELGIADHVPFRHPQTPLGHPLSDGGALLHRDLATTAAELGVDGDAWRRLLGPLARSSDVVDMVLSPFDLPRHPLELARFGLTAGFPAAALARLAFRTQHARALFAGLACHAIVPLGTPGTAAFGQILGGLGHNVGWPVAQGGSQRIADHLIARLRAAGGELVTGHRVRALADEPRARVTLLDLAPRQVVEVAGDRLPARYLARLRRFRRGAGVFKLDWALDGPVPWRDPRMAAAGTLHLGGTAAEIVAGESAVGHNRIAERPFVLFVQATVPDPSRAPAGRHTGWAYCHVPNGCTVDMTDAIENQVERYAPGFRDRILGRHAMSPADVETHDNAMIGGDINGGSAAWAQALFRPVASLDPWSTPLPGLYLCSASTPPGGGVHGMGGWHASSRALLRLGG